LTERPEKPRDPVTLDIHQILAILPHRYPFVMVDRVTEILPGKSIRGHKCVPSTSPGSLGISRSGPSCPAC
jgi:3-hydroxyacyl-[acyl-carrier-protein] dehydratase